MNKKSAESDTEAGTSTASVKSSIRSKYRKKNTDESKKKGLLRRLRSKTTPIVPPEHFKKEENNNNNNNDNIENKPRTTVTRKKSFSALLGIDDAKGSRLRRSNSMRVPIAKDGEKNERPKTLYHDNPEDSVGQTEEKTPEEMFPATTMFVPGYDFATGAKIDLEKAESRLSYSRRGSREKIRSADSSPNATRKHSVSPLSMMLREANAFGSLVKLNDHIPRRGSMPKLSQLPSFLKRSRERMSLSNEKLYQVSSSARNIVQEQSSKFSGKFPTNAKPKFTTPIEDLETCVRDLDIDARKSLLIKRQLEFINKKKTHLSVDMDDADVDQQQKPKELYVKKVKELSSAFETGVIYSEPQRRTNSLPAKQCRYYKDSLETDPQCFAGKVGDQIAVEVACEEQNKERRDSKFGNFKPHITVVQMPQTLNSYQLDVELSDDLNKSWPTKKWRSQNDNDAGKTNKETEQLSPNHILLKNDKFDDSSIYVRLEGDENYVELLDSSIYAALKFRDPSYDLCVTEL